jgi:RNA polymerase sigma factor (sigma-70 family)
MPGNIDPERFRLLLRSHPESAINLLVKHYWSTLIKISRNFTNDIESARDIVQETFAHVWEKHKSLSESHEKTIDNYLVQVVRYKSITHFKKNIRLSDLKQSYLRDTAASEDGAEAHIIKDEVVAAIRAIIATFPGRERQCLELKIDRELTNAEIARELNVTVKAVERTITSAYKRLRKHITTYP